MCFLGHPNCSIIISLNDAGIICYKITHLKISINFTMKLLWVCYTFISVKLIIHQKILPKIKFLQHKINSAEKNSQKFWNASLPLQVHSARNQTKGGHGAEFLLALCSIWVEMSPRSIYVAKICFPLHFTFTSNWSRVPLANIEIIINNQNFPTFTPKIINANSNLLCSKYR